MGHKHSVRDTGAHFTIDQYTRQIKNDSANKTTIVQYDHNSERLTFEMPLYIDGHAMTLCDLIEIHYINIATDGKSQNDGTYEVEDIKAEGEKAVFTWLISQECTQLAGSLNFFIVFKCTENGVTVYRWGTEIYKNQPISEGGNNGEAVLTEYPDIIAQWKARIFGASDEAVLTVETAKTNALAAIESAGEAKKQAVLNSIPDEYEALFALADSNYRNKAGAIVLDSEGESIVVNDASEYPLQNLKVFGKSEQITTTGAQILPISDFDGKTDRGLTQFVKGGICTVRGTATSTAAFNLTLCGSYYATEPFFTLAPGTYTVKDCMIVSNNGTTSKKYEDTTFTLTEEFGVTWVATRSYAPNEMVAETTYPMLNVGDAALPFEPYSDGVASPSPDYPQEINSVENAVVNFCGKNLIPNIISRTVANVSFTANEDGSFTVNGTADAYRAGDSAPIDATPFRGETVTLSGKQVFGSGLALQLFCKCESGNKFNTITGANPITFVIPDDAITMALQCYITNNATVDNVVIYPQLELGEKETAFEPYKEPQAVAISRTLPGIPVSSGGNYTDAGGQRWVRDEIDLKRGVHVHRCGYYIFDGSDDEEWNGIYTHDSKKYVYIKVPRGSIQYTTPLICNYAKHGAWSSNNVCFINNYAEFVVGGVALEGVLSSVAAFKAHLAAHPIVLAYVLETPVETALSDAELTAFKALHSNKPVTTILNDAGAFMAVEYVADTKTYIDNKIKELTEGVTA